MRTATIVIALLVLGLGSILVWRQRVAAEEALRVAQAHRVQAEAFDRERPPASANASANSSVDELREENAELKQEVEQLRQLIAELEAAARAGK